MNTNTEKCNKEIQVLNENWKSTTAQQTYKYKYKTLITLKIWTLLFWIHQKLLQRILRHHWKLLLWLPMILLASSRYKVSRIWDSEETHIQAHLLWGLRGSDAWDPLHDSGWPNNLNFLDKVFFLRWRGWHQHPLFCQWWAADWSFYTIDLLPFWGNSFLLLPLHFQRLCSDELCRLCHLGSKCSKCSIDNYVSSNIFPAVHWPGCVLPALPALEAPRMGTTYQGEVWFPLNHCFARCAE